MVLVKVKGREVFAWLSASSKELEQKEVEKTADSYIFPLPLSLGDPSWKPFHELTKSSLRIIPSGNPWESFLDDWLPIRFTQYLESNVEDGETDSRTDDFGKREEEMTEMIEVRLQSLVIAGVCSILLVMYWNLVFSR